MSGRGTRGDHFPLLRVLFSGPDFQALPGTARWTFVVLKKNMSGMAGIDVWYKSEILARLMAETGWTDETVTADLALLERDGWIRRQENILWVVDHLTFDAHAHVQDRKKRVRVQSHVAALPRRQIVMDYIAHHPDWFPPSECAEEGLGWAIRSPTKVRGESAQSLRSVCEESVNNSNNNNNSNSVRASGEDAGPVSGLALLPYADAESRVTNWPAEAAEWWAVNVGHVSVGQAGKMLKPVVDQHGWPKTLAGLREYADERKRAGKDMRLAWFVSESTRWIETATEPTTNEQGDLTATGKRIAGLA